MQTLKPFVTALGRALLTGLFSFVVTLVAITAATAFAGDAPIDVTLPLSDMGFFSLSLEKFGGLKGASAMTIAATVTQVAMHFFRTPLAGFVGAIRLVIVAALSVVSLYLSQLALGVDSATVLLGPEFLLAVQVLGNQIGKQIRKVPEDKAAIAATKASQS